MGLSRLFICFKRPKFNYTSQIIKLKAQRDELEQYKDILKERLSKFNDLCLKYVKENDKTNALFVLKRKALVSKQLSIIDEFTLKILEVISHTETANLQSEVLKNIEIGSKLLKEINKELKRKDFESFMESDKKNLDEIAETLGMINRSYEVDDLELAQELDLLTSELNSISFDQSYSHGNSNEQFNFNLDLTKLQTVSNVNTYTNRNLTSRSNRSSQSIPKSGSKGLDSKVLVSEMKV